MFSTANLILGGIANCDAIAKAIQLERSPSFSFSFSFFHLLSQRGRRTFFSKGLENGWYTSTTFSFLFSSEQSFSVSARSTPLQDIQQLIQQWNDPTARHWSSKIRWIFCWIWICFSPGDTLTLHRKTMGGLR